MKHRHLTLLKITPVSIFLLSFFLNYTIGRRDKQILSPALGHMGRRTVSTAWWDCSRKAFVSGNYFANGAQSGYFGRLLVDTRTGARGFLVGIRWNITDSATYLDSCIVMTIQKTLTRHHSYDQLWKLRTIFHWFICYILKPNWTFSRWWNCCAIQKQSTFQTIMFQRNTGTKTYQLCDSKEYTYNMIVYFGKNRECVGPSMTSSHAT
jgi:hypothetical protein